MNLLFYSLTIEATKDPTFFSFYSPDLPGFTGAGETLEDGIDLMSQYLGFMQEMGLGVPEPNPNPIVRFIPFTPDKTTETDEKNSQR